MKFAQILCDNRLQEPDAYTDSHCFVELSEKNGYLEKRSTHIVLGDVNNDGVGLIEKGRVYSRGDGMAEVQMQGMTWHEEMDLAATGGSTEDTAQSWKRKVWLGFENSGSLFSWILCVGR